MHTTSIDRLGTAATLAPDEAHTQLQQLQEDWDIIPAHAQQTTWALIDQIVEAAVSSEVTTVGRMLVSASSLISQVSGVRQVTAFHNDSDAAALHSTRNALAALITAAYAGTPSDLRQVRAAYTMLPQLKMRTHEHSRPLEDDEVVVCRLHALHLVLSGTPTERRNGAAYVVGDAGLPPTEATSVRVDDLNLRGDLPLLMMPPARSFEDRLLRLEPFHVRALRLHIDSLDTELLTYRPRKNAPGSDQAAASMHGVLGRLLKTVGIANDDLTASCVYTAGLRRILDTSGVEDALLAAGLPPTSGHRLLKLLGRDTEEPTTPTMAPAQHANGF